MKSSTSKKIIFLLLGLGFVIVDLLFLKFLSDISLLIGGMIWVLLFVKFKIGYKYFLTSALFLFILQIFFVPSPETWLKDRVASWIFFLILFSAISSIFEKEEK